MLAQLDPDVGIHPVLLVPRELLLVPLLPQIPSQAPGLLLGGRRRSGGIVRIQIYRRLGRRARPSHRPQHVPAACIEALQGRQLVLLFPVLSAAGCLALAEQLL